MDMLLSLCLLGLTHLAVAALAYDAGHSIAWRTIDRQLRNAATRAALIRHAAEGGHNG